MRITVEAGVEHYRLVGPNGEEGEMVPYEGIAAIKIGTQIYYCEAEDPDATEHKVYHVTECQEVDAITDDGVVFDGEEPEEPESDLEGDEEDEDDEEEEEVGPELVK